MPDKDTTQSIREARTADPENAPLGKSQARRCCKWSGTLSMQLILRLLFECKKPLVELHPSTLC